jgi:MtN3 and saliva related transmembrane protein
MVTLTGVLAAVLTTSCWIPQLRRTLRRGTASDFAWPYLAVLGAGLMAWCTYGALRRDFVILVSNSLVLLADLGIVTVKLRSRRLTVGQVEFVVPGGRHALATLESLVEIGPRLAADLRKVGICDLASLRTTGIDEANRRLMEAGLPAGSHSRKAIQEAIDAEWANGSGTTSQRADGGFIARSRERR